MSESWTRNIPLGTRVLAAMSGGVDSSVAARRLVEAGFDVIGITMHLVPVENRPKSGAQVSDEKSCCSVTAAEDARRVAADIGIPHYMLNLADEFEDKVMSPTRMEYARGRTPNPCVLCNRYMKFDVLFERAEQLGCTHVATGHYARITEDPDGLHLLRGIDPQKDQSYFLSFLTERELERIIFPLGWDTKESVREEAARVGLKVADRPESQDLCFFATGPIDTTDSFDEKISGKIVLMDGTVIGEHDGISGFTIGQRKGVPGGMPEKMYVVGINAEQNRVIVGKDEDLYSSGFSIDDISIVRDERGRRSLEGEVGVQVRYRAGVVKGNVNLQAGEVRLSKPVRAVTPGQAAVFYTGEEVIGGSTIDVVDPGERESLPGQ